MQITWTVLKIFILVVYVKSFLRKKEHALVFVVSYQTFRLLPSHYLANFFFPSTCNQERRTNIELVADLGLKGACLQQET